jgi:hypothetical protein
MSFDPKNLTPSQALEQLSLTAANFGNAEVFRDVFDDWVKFLGGKPGEVVVVDGGSTPQMHDIYWEMFKAHKINKLQVIHSDHPENDKNQCYFQEHAAGAIANKPYLLFFKADTLPYRQGHDDWLAEAIGYLERPDTFAVGGSFNSPAKHHDAWPGWFFSHKCSLNFALMKRDNYISAMEEFAGEFISSGFRSTNPLAGVSDPRYVMETSLETYMRNHNMFTLARIEDPTWTVFHTNVMGPKLVKVREDYYARRNIASYMNAGNYNRIYCGSFYGRPPLRWAHFKWAISESRLGPLVRLIKRLLGLGQTVPPARRSS